MPTASEKTANISVLKKITIFNYGTTLFILENRTIYQASCYLVEESETTAAQPVISSVKLDYA